MSEPLLVPQLIRSSGFLRRAASLPLHRELPGSPFATCDAGLAAITSAGTTGRVFLITYTPVGWVGFEYNKVGLGAVDLGELVLDGLPLGGSASNPQTYLVSGKGTLGKIVPDSEGRYVLRKIDRPVAPVPVPAAQFVPFVVPQTLENYSRNVTWRPRFALRPGPDVALLSSALRWIDEHLPPEVKIKAGGWRHSWSPVAATDGVYVHPDEMKGVVAIHDDAAESAVLDAALDRCTHFAVLAGTRIRDISSALWAEGKALPYLGGWDGQTLGGVLPTGTHGSCLRHGPLAEMVRSVDLIRFDGSKVRVEPQSAAITVPQRFREQRPDWSLIQNDDTFNALLVSMGSMGVCHRFIIEARGRFWLKEVRTVTTMQEAEGVLRNGNIYHLMETAAHPSWICPTDDRRFADCHPKPAYHLELLWNPYTDTVVVTSRHFVDESTRLAFIGGGEPEWFANAPIRNLFRLVKLDIMAARFSRPDLPELLTEFFWRVLDELLELATAIAPRLIPRVLDHSLKQMKDLNGYTQRSYKVFNVGEGANSIPAQSGTCSVPLRDDLWLQAVGVIRDVARSAARERKEYQTGPISLRFVRGSRILLADPVDVCKFELIFGGDNERVRALAERQVRQYYLALCARFGADVRLHWGQLIPKDTLETPGPSGSRVRACYPRYDDWRRQRDALDPKGRGLNPWQERLLPQDRRVLS